jgi:hypothetical protein
MTDIAKCNNKDCIHAKECERYRELGEFLYDIKAVCNEQSNYKLLIKIENNIAQKESEK